MDISRDFHGVDFHSEEPYGVWAAFGWVGEWGTRLGCTVTVNRAKLIRPRGQDVNVRERVESFARENDGTPNWAVLKSPAKSD